MEIEKKVVYFDPISGETLVLPVMGTSMPNLTRGPYIDEDGQSFYIRMTQIHPSPLQVEAPDNGKE